MPVASDPTAMTSDPTAMASDPAPPHCNPMANVTRGIARRLKI